MQFKPDDLMFMVMTDMGSIGFSLKEIILGYEKPESRPDYWDKLIELLRNDDMEIHIIEEVS